MRRDNARPPTGVDVTFKYCFFMLGVVCPSENVSNEVIDKRPAEAKCYRVAAGTKHTKCEERHSPSSITKEEKESNYEQN